MGKFIVRRIFLLLLTMILVSMAVFVITEASPGNVARNILGAFVTPEQEASFLAQLGLDKPVWVRYLYWLVGSDWQASDKVGRPLKRIMTEKGFVEWWAIREDGQLVRWKLSGDDLIAEVRQKDGTKTKEKDNDRWATDEKGVSIFWGLDNDNHAVKWEKGTDRKVWTFIMGSGWKETSGGPIEYIPLKKGFIRGDPGVSLRTGRPVGNSLYVRLRNTLVLAGIAFVIVMPLALVLGLLAGLKEGSHSGQDIVGGWHDVFGHTGVCHRYFSDSDRGRLVGRGTGRNRIRGKGPLEPAGHADFAGVDIDADRIGLCFTDHSGKHGGGDAFPIYPDGPSEGFTLLAHHIQACHSKCPDGTDYRDYAACQLADGRRRHRGGGFRVSGPG